MCQLLSLARSRQNDNLHLELVLGWWHCRLENGRRVLLTGGEHHRVSCLRGAQMSCPSFGEHVATTQHVSGMLTTSGAAEVRQPIITDHKSPHFASSRSKIVPSSLPLLFFLSFPQPLHASRSTVKCSWTFCSSPGSPFLLPPFRLLPPSPSFASVSCLCVTKKVSFCVVMVVLSAFFYCLSPSASCDP